MLRRFTVLGVAIVLVWGLSPVGGQSSLRILSTIESKVPSLQQLYYFDTNDTATSMLGGADDLDTFAPAIGALYGACLLAPEYVKSSPRDLWNNVKIPMLDAISQTNTGSMDDSWLVVNQNQSHTYSSLTGLMIAGLPSVGSSNFTIQSSYLDLSCSNGTDVNGSTESLNATLDGRLTVHNASNLFFGPVPTYDVDGPNSFFIDSNNPSEVANPKTVPNLVYGALDEEASPTVWLYNCTIATTRVESNIICDGKLCFVDRIRRSDKDQSLTNANAFSENPVAFENLLVYFPWAAGLVHDGIDSPTDLYIQGQSSPFEANTELQDGYGDITGDVLAKRLSTLLNTVWQSALAPTTTAIAPSTNLTVY